MKVQYHLHDLYNHAPLRCFPNWKRQERPLPQDWKENPKTRGLFFQKRVHSESENSKRNHGRNSYKNNMPEIISDKKSAKRTYDQSNNGKNAYK